MSQQIMLGASTDKRIHIVLVDAEAAKQYSLCRLVIDAQLYEPGRIFTTLKPCRSCLEESRRRGMTATLTATPPDATTRSGT